MTDIAGLDDDALSAELPPIGSKKLGLGQLLPGNAKGTHHASDIEKVAVVQVVGNAVAAPGSASHRQRERKAVVEAAAGGEAMRLVDDHAAYRQLEAERKRARVVLAVQPDRVAGALVAKDAGGKRRCVREI